MSDDDKLPTPGTGQSIGRHGEDVARDDDEAGGVDLGKRGVSGRPSGGATARTFSGIDPQEPIDDGNGELP